MTEEAQPQQPEQEVSITLKVSEVNIILGALDEIPHKVSRNVIDKVLQQAQAQLKPAE